MILDTCIAAKRLLDIGCGNSKSSCEGYIVVGLDHIWESDADIIAAIDKGCLPFKENTFEIIAMSHVLEHVSNPVQLLGEVHRVGIQGGTVIVKVPHYTNLRAYEIHHKTYYNYFSLEPLCGKPGKSAEQLRMFNIKERRIVLRAAKEKKGPLRMLLVKYLEDIVNKYPYRYENYLSKILPAYEVYHRLEIAK